MRTCPSCRGLVPETEVSTCAHCHAPLPRMRFRLHPASVPDDEADDVPAAVAPPAPRAPAARGTPARAPPRASAAAAAPALVDRVRPYLDNRRLMVAAVIVLLVLMGSGTAAYLEFSPTARYPERYLLQGDEMPSGLQNAEVTAEVRDDHEISENPGRMSESQLREVGSRFGVKPTEGWAQLLSDGDGEPVLVILPLRFEDENAADKGVRGATAICGLGAGRVYQHGSVAVVLYVEDSDGLVKLNDVSRALLDKSRLERVC